MLVAEAVGVAAVHRGVEGVVAGGDGAFLDLVGAVRFLDLFYQLHKSVNCVFGSLCLCVVL